MTRTRSCFTAFSRSFAIAPCDSSRSSRLVINWTSFGAPAKPVAGTLKIPGFLRRTEFIEGTTALAPGKPAVHREVNAACAAQLSAYRKVFSTWHSVAADCACSRNPESSSSPGNGRTGPFSFPASRRRKDSLRSIHRSRGSGRHRRT